MKMSEEIRTELKLIAEELGGEYHEQSLLDSRGVEKRRVIITYPDDK